MSGPTGGVQARRVAFEVAAGDVTLRLDQLLAAHVPGLSRRQARLLLDLGGVFVDRQRVKIASRTLRPGQRVEAWVGGVLARATGPGASRVGEASGVVVHEDDALVVVEKPSGLLSAPTPESDRGNLFTALRRDGRAALWLVHRIDRETSGLLVFAKTAAANASLAEQFRTHTVERAYLAVVAGSVGSPSCTVTEPIGGRRAITHFTIDRGLGSVATMLRARLETGRTHQIRIHAKAMGHPVLGDRTHGVRTENDPPRMALHATMLGFVHPATGAAVRWTSPWPADLASWLAGLGAVA